MPLGEGWWLDLKTGQAISIYEHASAVKEDPERYRLKPEQVRDLVPGTPKDRDILRLLAAARGFVRVRYDRGQVTVEFDAARYRPAVASILTFLVRTFGPDTRVNLHDLRRKRRFVARVEASEAFLTRHRNSSAP